MAIQTTLTLTSNSPSNGDVQLVSGQVTGDRNRTVTISARPKPGSVFLGWEIEKYPVQYPESGLSLAGFAYSKDSLCAQPNIMQQIPDITYKDENGTLYKDIYGKEILADGFWASSATTYIEIRNGLVFNSGTCGGNQGGGDGGGDNQFQF